MPKNTKIIIPLIWSLLTGDALFASQQANDPYRAPYTEHGLVIADYQIISLPDNDAIDLLGLRYLQQLNDWFYFGLGTHAPLVKGDYGGFMTLDATLQVQHEIYDGLFFDAGVTLGGGGGGSSVAQSKILSGSSGFGMGFIGLGYTFDNNFSVGLNYSHVKFADSPIDNSQVCVFVQKPVSYSVGSYADAGRTVGSAADWIDSNENILTFELNNIMQIDPQGTDKQNIHTVALQFSHFFDKANYLFVEAEIGYKGMPLYNQIVPGIGHRFALSRDVNLYGQLGVGSGGYAPTRIDTGAGLLIYPKLSLEYMFNDSLGAALTGGYLAAPTGTSRNYTAGAALNYHLSYARSTTHDSGGAEDSTYKGMRLSIFQETEFNVKIDNNDYHNINLLATQLDALINPNWYVAAQVSMAYNEFKDSPGYGELLAGIGVQDSFAASDTFQSFLQLMIGANSEGVIFKPAVGTTLSLSDNLALYAQLGATMSVNAVNLYGYGGGSDQSLRAYNAGLGVSWRFSVR